MIVVFPDHTHVFFSGRDPGVGSCASVRMLGLLTDATRTNISYEGLGGAGSENC